MFFCFLISNRVQLFYVSGISNNNFQVERKTNSCSARNNMYGLQWHYNPRMPSKLQGRLTSASGTSRTAVKRTLPYKIQLYAVYPIFYLRTMSQTNNIYTVYGHPTRTVRRRQMLHVFYACIKQCARWNRWHVGMWACGY